MAETSPGTLGTALHRVAGAAAIVGLAIAFSLGPVLDADLGWHLKAGQWIAAHRAMPWTDPFAQAGRPWFEYAWLYDLFITGLHHLWGLRGLVVYRGVMDFLIAIAVWHLARAREGSRTMAWWVTVAALFALQPSLTERSYLFSIAFVALTLAVLFRLRAGRTRGAFALALAYVIWANTHVEFVYGLMILGLGCGAPLLDRVLRREPADRSDAARAFTPGWWRLSGLTAVCALATLVNPGGWRLWEVVVGYALARVPFHYIVEFNSPDLSLWGDRITLALALVAAATLIVQKQRSTFEPLVLLMGCALGARTEHDAWFAALTAVPMVASLRVPRFFPRWPRAVAALELAALAAGGALLVAAVRRQTEPWLEQALAGAYPAAAVRYIEANRLPGPLYNDFNWGGFLIWRLPRLKVAVDGRTPQYPDDELKRSFITWRGQATADTVDPKLARARLIVASPASGLTPQLARDPRWRLAYQDAVARVFVRASPDH